ncbi:uncharacterized protein [Procambarus clarkii]|uniref:uncharacterized protein isoform X2 n=1 Tax=Procambarus clarkii TaxID=6728 RepID=UPI0037447498
MVCLPFKPAAGTNVPANIRVVDEAHTKMLWKVLATELQENTCRSTNVVWKVQKSLCQLLKQNQVKVIMMHGLGLLYSAKGNLQKWNIDGKVELQP